MLTQLWFRSSDGSWPVSVVRSLWESSTQLMMKHTGTITATMKLWGKAELWITVLNQSILTLIIPPIAKELVQKAAVISSSTVRMDLPLERRANPWNMRWAEKRILPSPLDDKLKKPCLDQWAARTWRINVGNEKVEMTFRLLKSRAANR